MTAAIPEDAVFSPPPRKTHIRHRSEADIVSEALDYLRGVGYARKVHGGSMGNAGEPDIDACVNGRSVKLEAKRPGQKPTAAQIGALRRWREAGALVGWFTSLDHIEQILGHTLDRHAVELEFPGCSCSQHALTEVV